MNALDLFHPDVAAWFRETLGEPTPPQERAWPLLLQGRDVLVAAPTGSGKTLAAFLAALDGLARQAEAGELRDEVRVVYVSPLKALSNDIHKNLLLPLEGIRARLQGSTPIRAAVRTGDTPQAERGRTLKLPPHVLVTTPESLFVLLTSASGRKMLSTARTVILDEIHAVAANRRGAHMALTVERLEHACGRPLQRIGLSATQRPVAEVARFLVGAGRVEVNGRPRCDIVDEGHLRHIDLEVAIPRSPLEAVMSNEVWDEMVGAVADLVVEHRTTLIFVNTRRLAERVAARLGEALGERIDTGLVSAHHGSMSRERRLDAEERLKRGELRALVATSSLELGIDVGAVDLVCQIGSTRSIAGLLQRVGRAGHHKNLVPKGRIFPLSRDELAEAGALCAAVRAGDLDALRVPAGGLDVLCQQFVAAAADEEWNRDELFALARRAWPYCAVTDKDLTDALELAVHGVQTQRGRRGAHLFLDVTTGAVRGRRGARLAALTSGGAIPDQGDYTVVEGATGAVVGTLNEDFAIESMPGDVFQLGTTSWRILRIERGIVRVENAKGQPPTIPFWLGEAPARTPELSEHVSALREEVEQLAVAGAGIVEVTQRLFEAYRLPQAAAGQLAEYLLAVRASLGALPTKRRVIFERFLDELGGSQIVVHAPFGGRITRAWGLALRKRFCRTFDFELQAAANEDGLLLSVGAVSGVRLEELPRFLTSRTVRQVLVQALLDAPMFGVRFRWNASRALTLLRTRGGKRIPPGLQRIEAEDLLVSLFPEQRACLENIVGDREVPDALLVRQTVEDCLNEAMDIEGLERVLAEIEAGRIEVRCVETSMPSPLAHEILAAKPYAFLDDVPLEERRVQAVYARGALDAAAQGEGAPLDVEDVRQILAEIHPPCENADEAHDLLLQHAFLRDDELQRVGGTRMPELVEELAAAGRVRRATAAGRDVMLAVERVQALGALGIGCSGNAADRSVSLTRTVQDRTEVAGPKTVTEHAAELGTGLEETALAVEELLKSGELLRGRFDDYRAEPSVWSRRLVARARRRSLEKLRAGIEPVTPRDLMRFLLRWQHVEEPLRGAAALPRVLLRLDGCAAPAAAWEEEILPRRLADYDPRWLDQLCLAGHVEYVRLDAPRPTSPSTLRTVPLALVDRAHTQLYDRTAVSPDSLSSNARAVLGMVERRGPSFLVDLLRETRLLPEQLEGAMAELVAGGLLTSDGFAGLRRLLRTSRDRDRLRRAARRSSARRPAPSDLDAAGRWSLVRVASAPDPAGIETRAEAQARLLLQRTGVVFRKLVEREVALLPWRDLLRALRRLEARGEVRGGRFVAGFSGEQFALPEVVSLLRAMRREPLEQRRVVLSAADPLNLTGIILPGARVSAVLGHRILLEDGLAVAVLDAAGVRSLAEDDSPDADVSRMLRQPTALRAWRPGARRAG